jgi:putative transposase
MIKNRRLSRSIADVSWHTFILMLEYKAQWSGKQFTKVKRFLPTSKTCSNCKTQQTMKLSERIYKCSACGLVLDRDLNASLNIQAAGHAVFNACGAISSS